MSLDEFWGHCIDGRATVQETPTVFIINSDPGYVLRSSPMSKWIGVQEGSFLRCLQTKEASSGDAGWVMTGFWGAWPPFFVITSFVFKLAFTAVLLRSFRHSLTRWSGLPHLKTISIFPLIQPDCIGKTNNIPNQQICSSNSTWDFCSWRLGLFLPFRLHAQVFFSFVAFHYSRSSSEGTIALQLPGGKQIPWCLRTTYFWSPSCCGLWE